MEPVIEKGRQMLKCEFTREELEEFAGQMARAVAEQEAASADLESVKTQIKYRITEASGTITSSAEKIRSGYEYRPVDVTTTKDFIDGTVTAARHDTGEVILSRKMTDEERQIAFPEE